MPYSGHKGLKLLRDDLKGFVCMEIGLKARICGEISIDFQTKSMVLTSGYVGNKGFGKMCDRQSDR